MDFCALRQNSEESDELHARNLAYRSDKSIKRAMRRIDRSQRRAALAYGAEYLPIYTSVKKLFAHLFVFMSIGGRSFETENYIASRREAYALIRNLSGNATLVSMEDNAQREEKATSRER